MQRYPADYLQLLHRAAALEEVLPAQHLGEDAPHAPNVHLPSGLPSASKERLPKVLQWVNILTIVKSAIDQPRLS